MDNKLDSLYSDYDNLNNDYRDLNALCYSQEHYIAKLRKRNWLWFSTTIIATLAALLAVVL